ncbi:MAG TPA: hypothetical protein VEX86_01905 [Longimicrobium sp.]|nr:hypothetical protein [Longimicrobium sp.]
MNDSGLDWRRIAAAGAVLAAGAAASVYVVRALRERAREAPGRRGPSAGRPLTVIRGGAGEG